MDTKLKNTEKQGFEKNIPKKSKALKQSSKPKQIIAFTAFFVGLTLFLGSLLFVFGDVINERLSEKPWENTTRDYQQTDRFRSTVEYKLNDFIGMATDSLLSVVDSSSSSYYSGQYKTEVINEILMSGNTVTYGSSLASDKGEAREYNVEEVAPLEGEQRDIPTKEDNQKAAASLNESIKNDKNLLYVIAYEGKILYKNTEELKLDSDGKNLPDGYNFFLSFKDSKAAIIKDGVAQDIYGDGYYHEGESEWMLPGYKNIIADENAAKVQICFAVASDPQIYRYRIYSHDNTSGSTWNSEFYEIEQNQQSMRTDIFIRSFAMLLGLLLLGLSLIMRKNKKAAKASIAEVTRHIPIEIKLLTFGLFFIVWLVDLFAGRVNLYYTFSTFSFSQLYQGLVFVTFWLGYLLVNDLRHNKGQLKSGIFARLHEQGMTHPISKRFGISQLVIFILIILFATLTLWTFFVFTGNFGFGFEFKMIFTFAFIVIAPALIFLFYFYAKRMNAIIRDVGTLTDKIDAIAAGADSLSQTFTLPENSDLRKAADSLNNIQESIGTAVAEQTKSERMKLELITNVSHDIKTPLTSIISYVELLKGEQSLPDNVKEYVAVLDSKSERLKEIVQDVFEISKAAAGQLPITTEPIDLCKLLHQTLADMAEPLEKSSIILRTDIPPEPVMITSDGGRLYRVFQNLIQNALSYSLDGSRVYLSLKASESIAVVSIKNTSKSELPKDFDFTERFVRGDESRTDGGSGLGLSIAKSFTEACGGKMKIETQADLFTATVEFRI